jgi:Flp pilus assembly pilin Flp
MATLYHAARRFFSDERGTTSVEYAVMLALIFVAVIASVMTFGNTTQQSFNTTNTNLTTHGFGS